ncbi:uncharacterized protein LOC144667431 [Oculina patagonica]
MKAVCVAMLVSVLCMSGAIGQIQWRKLNTSPVCFGTTNSAFGTFKIPSGGNLQLIKLKLVHLYGYVSCVKNVARYYSHWGCGFALQNPEYVLLAITDAYNEILLPPKQLRSSAPRMVFVPGYTSQTPELVLSVFDNPLAVQTGKELRIWYTEDLLNRFESDNDGRVCCDVYADFI